ncbi:sialate O-acetylesterase [Aporhodopirellula aestuarii]|uniref:Sialate O-acetylesterase n=1 Tax=Aporhodopirellula aestuarii TaxID=2950107 RepID=A0ABT0U5X2_9BACT|nr:sialate O-acetylesterase [Aporhodopirellula aestuarii]MCM2372303.1 sialate O-acetylesterase [Aporhodopirellula aestuarii]
MKRLLLIFALLVIFPDVCRAELSLPNFFSDHMVLQRERSAAIWGTASPGSEVTVSFKDETARVKADADGHWRVGVDTGAADSNGATLEVAAGGERISINDVLVGEVWLASGQSNMVFTMDRVPAYKETIAESDYPLIRMFNAPTVTATEPQDDIDGEWTLCSPETVPGYSAVAYFFARKLHMELGIPIGVIKTAWGGKPVETFTSREALNTLPGTKAMVDALLEADAGYDPAKAEVAYQARLDQWEAARAEWMKKPSDQRGRLARKPTRPKRPLDTEGKPGVLFDSMIHPFVGYTMRGAIWYQGEANAKPGAVAYDQTLPLMIRDWRQRWDDDFSFYFVQLANFRAPSTEPGTPDAWALLQDRMRRILDTTPKTGMAVINDVGEANDIHPKNKKDPGERLALWALAKDYGRDIVYSGPLFESSRVEEGRIRVSFRQTGDGLKSRDGKPLQRFEIAGEDRVWHWADATIEGSEVVVSSTDVKRPVAVRYAWAANPSGANLVNSLGLPASVFRTDDWDDVEVAADSSASKAQTRRRSLAAEIKALNARIAKLDRQSAEFSELQSKRQELLSELRGTAPTAGKAK